MMDRRTLVASLLTLVGSPCVTRAQTARPAGKIGYIHQVSISPSNTSFAILQPAWQKLGYVDGLTALTRSAEGDPQKLPGVVTELIAQGAGVLIVVGADAVRAAVRTAKTTPIIAIDLETDPVRAGLIASYAKPSGNVTGLFLDMPSLASKWIELLLATVPELQRIALVWQPSTGREQLDIALDAARAMGVEPVVVEITPTDDFDVKFSAITSDKRTGIVQIAMPGLIPVAAAYAAAAERRGLPTMTHLRGLAKGGCLMSYGPSLEAFFPRAVEMADKILRGEKVGDMPIERPSKFEFVVNLKTASALGITIPPSILIRADEVIE